MHKWNIDIYLKSGVKLECVYSCTEDSTFDVSNKLFMGRQFTDIVGFDKPAGNGNIYVIVGEIAAFDIYVEDQL